MNSRFRVYLKQLKYYIKVSNRAKRKWEATNDRLFSYVVCTTFLLTISIRIFHNRLRLAIWRRLGKITSAIQIRRYKTWTHSLMYACICGAQRVSRGGLKVAMYVPIITFLWLNTYRYSYLRRRKCPYADIQFISIKLFRVCGRD